MKNIVISSFLVLSAALLGSCNDFLDTPPKSTQTLDQYYQNEEEAQMAANGLYAWLGTRFTYAGYGEAPAFMLEYPTGYCYYTAGQQSLINPDLEKLNYWDRNYVDYWWQSCYYGIEACNMFLAAVPQLPESDAIDQMLGEAHFLRAYYYFHLVRIFGDVPLKLTPTSAPVDGMLTPTSVKEIYEQVILPDLEAASSSPISYTPSSGRVSMEAVNALYAQVYLTMAGSPLNETDKYQLAAQKAELVVNSSHLSLLQSDTNMSWFEKFRRKEFDNTGEYIFMANYGESPAPRQHYSQFFVPATAVKLTGFVGFGSMMPTQDFIDSFEKGDLRAEEKGFFFTSYNSWDNSGTLNFESAVYKFFEPTLVGQGGYCGKSIPLIRYAEMLLTYAEATARSGAITDKAIDAVNQIRSRAGLEPLSAAVTSNKEAFIDAVMTERVHELCFENVTFFDMIRTQKAYITKAKSWVNLEGFVEPSGAVFKTAEHTYFPVPLREVQINPELRK